MSDQDQRNKLKLERRRREALLFSPQERIKKMFRLMSIATILNKGPIKKPHGLGVVLKRKVS
ncbi:MAG: hypothetical protein M3R17_08065 [Bacteroidota bacterium]|nr:hypothetical protein [Bacteroidota bacterium]